MANAGNDEATGEACSPWITRLSFSNGQVNRPMGTWLHEQGVGKVYTLAPDYAAGRQMIDAFTASFTDAGGEIVGQQFTPFGKTQDFGPYLAKAQASGADAVYVFYAGGEAIIVSQWAPRRPKIGCASCRARANGAHSATAVIGRPAPCATSGSHDMAAFATSALRA